MVATGALRLWGQKEKWVEGRNGIWMGNWEVGAAAPVPPSQAVEAALQMESVVAAAVATLDHQEFLIRGNPTPRQPAAGDPIHIICPCPLRLA